MGFGTPFGFTPEEQPAEKKPEAKRPEAKGELKKPAPRKKTVKE